MANEGSDLKLFPGQVKVEAWDLCIDSKDRRKNDSPHRRALVHDFDDGLTLNWGGDYPGGVRVEGELKASEITLEKSLTVYLEFNLKTGEISAPSELDAKTKEAAWSEARRIRELTSTHRLALPGGSARPAASSSDGPLSLSESRAVLANLGESMVSDIVLPVDIVKMVADLSEEVETLKKALERAQENWR